MRKLKCVLMFGLVLLLIAGCSKEEIKPETLNAADNVSLKSAKASKQKCKGDHYVPFKATFELAAVVDHYGPVMQLDYQTDWMLTAPAGGMWVEIQGSGNATHLGRTEFEIFQWWTKFYPYPGLIDPDSYGQGEITFTAANGDKLTATYYGTADHQDDPPTEILTHGIFTGGTGRFAEVSGTFLWDGLFVKTVPGMPPPGTEFGTGEVTVTGRIKY